MNTDEIIEVADRDQLVRKLTAWHRSQVAVLEHMLIIPVGTEMTIGKNTFLFEGLFLDGFKAGIEAALIELGELPFIDATEKPNAVTRH